ncbi:hypothetical protein B0H34DRAFT_400298 [Crassisporium funariophilum]|nr:hypothetical protein B0H34DRAFT_400298 [Crassisporium funariophilum]
MDYDINNFYAMVKTVQEARYAIAAMYGLQLYEWASGFDKEIRLIHRAQWTWIKTMYLLCRYYPLCLWIVIIWAYVGDHDAQLCSRVAYPVHAILAPCQFFSQAAVMVMRAYAFTGRNTAVLVLLGLCYVCLLGLDLWVFCAEIDVPPTLFYVLLQGSGCFPNYGEAVIAVHCQKTRCRDISLARYFINQGFIAFAFILLVNVAAAVSFFRPPSYHHGVGLPVVLAVSNLVACRHSTITR